MEKKDIGPSWSWSSFVWGSQYPQMRWEHESKISKKISSDRIGSYTQDSRVRIISVSVKIDGLNKYGMVTRGRIVIEGAICAVTIGKSSGPLPSSLSNIVRSEDVFHFNYDTPTSEASAG
ncbi:hypothetical protein M422DRAFT_45318 [Sphaerobolus stellatus SS14]|nr:hypothetical protein M422DRAFT_45318 [Sphaerobolus stellatus SS14]